MGSRHLCPKEALVTLSPNVLLNVWPEADSIWGFTELLVSDGLVCYGFGFQLDTSCLGWRRLSEHIGAGHFWRHTFRTHEGFSLGKFISSIPFIQTGHPGTTRLGALTWPQMERLEKVNTRFFFFCFPPQNYSAVQKSYFKFHESALSKEFSMWGLFLWTRFAGREVTAASRQTP